MTLDAEVADDFLLVGRRSGRCGEAAPRVAGDEDRRTGDGRKTLQNVAKTRQRNVSLGAQRGGGTPGRLGSRGR